MREQCKNAAEKGKETGMKAQGEKFSQKKKTPQKTKNIIHSKVQKNEQTCSIKCKKSWPCHKRKIQLVERITQTGKKGDD